MGKNWVWGHFSHFSAIFFLFSRGGQNLHFSYFFLFRARSRNGVCTRQTGSQFKRKSLTLLAGRGGLRWTKVANKNFVNKSAFPNRVVCGLSGPMSRDTAILSLRYPISRDTFQGRLALPQYHAIPPLST